MRIAAILFCALFTSSAFASTTKLTSMKISIHIGDKVSNFEIPDSRKLNILVNGRQKKTLRGNIDHALKLATQAAKEKSNDKNLCDRKIVTLTLSVKGAKETVTHGCVGSPNPAAKKLTELSNLMLFM